MIKAVTDLEVFNLSYGLALDIFEISRKFPKEEKYSLTDQVIRSSRSICANIAEGWGKRIYEADFKKHLVYSMGSIEETKLWLSFGKECGYISIEEFFHLLKKLEEAGRKIYLLHKNWKSL